MKRFREHIIENHPRPDFARLNRVDLCGDWEFALDRKGVGNAADYSGSEGFPYRIVVPFPVESELSGIGIKRPPKNVWYLKRFDFEEDLQGRRYFLKFGAVDYRAKVWFNSSYLGEHEGGYTPFEFEITNLLKRSGNKLSVSVEDKRTLYQIRGKQTFRKNSFNIFYTTATGIWQPVWIESTGPAKIESVKFFTEPSGEVKLLARIDGNAENASLRISVRAPDGTEVCSTKKKIVNPSGETIEFKVDPAMPWNPGDPNLYPTQIELLDVRGAVSDDVRTYFGLRKVEIRDGKVLINGAEFYHRFIILQGYFPDGIYRPGDPDLWRKDAQDALDMGFNGIRIHQKIEDPQFLYWCDALGLAAWSEMPSYLLPRKKLQNAFAEQWRSAIARDINHPSIIAWVPFNEQWGIQDVWLNSSRQHFFEDVVAQTRREDPTRPVISNSGWEHGNSDILDIHAYTWKLDMFEKVLDEVGTEAGRRFSTRKALFMGGKNGWPPFIKPLLGPKTKFENQPIIVSEYGGFGFYPNKKKNLLENFREYTLAIANRPHLAGFAYTQQYDTEQERNGLLTYDRKPKIEISEIVKINREVKKIVSGR